MTVLHQGQAASAGPEFSRGRAPLKGSEAGLSPRVMPSTEVPFDVILTLIQLHPTNFLNRQNSCPIRYVVYASSQDLIREWNYQLSSAAPI